MNRYLVDTQIATKGIFDLLSREEQRLNEKQKAFALMQNAAQSLFESMKSTYFDGAGIFELVGLENAKTQFASEVEEIASLINRLSPTYNALAGALLQIAKQGISAEYEGIRLCPDGRTIGTSETLKNVVWQGRNQSMHHEEGNYNRGVIECFENLKNDFGSQFTLSSHNLALSVIDILGWSSYKDFEVDMKLLLPDHGCLT